MKLTIIIGHRGTGKSHFLHLLQQIYQEQALYFDLDREVEKVAGESISELFNQKGEGFFRQWEKRVFHQIVNSIPKDKEAFLAVGAGFVFEKNPLWRVIHLSRLSDGLGRVFLDRPRLSTHKPSKSPYDENLYLYKKRAKFYREVSDEELFRREGWTDLELSDLVFLGEKALSSPMFSLRLNPQDLPQKSDQLNEFLQRRLNCWGIRFFELSDQSATTSFIHQVRELIPDEWLLFSSQCSKKFSTLEGKKNFSWDLSLGTPPKSANILSLHHRAEGQDLRELLKSFSAYKSCHLKLSVEIFHLQELRMAYEWQQEEPSNRSFLPRSKDGRWLWFRQAFGPEMFLHFIRERTALPTSQASLKKTTKAFAEGKKQLPEKAASFDVPDQPFLSQALPFVKRRRALAAVLGHPVSASASPAEQEDFFNRQRDIPFLYVPLTEEEMNKESLNHFQSLGFVFFAITSPLKEKAFLATPAASGDKISTVLKRTNSLVWHKAGWKGFNTDWEGVKQLKKFSSPRTVVWGGGGMRPALMKALPLARFYSAREGKPLSSLSVSQVNKIACSVRGTLHRFLSKGSHSASSSVGVSSDPLSTGGLKEGRMRHPKINFSDSLSKEIKKDGEFSPKTVIWAVGRKRMEEACQWPPRHWRISQVIDLNYTEDSPGREYALQTGAKYQSGREFFKAQAKKQRAIFKKLFPNREELF